MPNTVALSHDSFNSQELESEAGPQILKTKHRPSLYSQVFRSFSFERVPHPLFHRDYSFSFQTAPVFQTFSTDVLLYGGTGGQIWKSRLDFYGLSYNFFSFFHTPIGSFSLGIGYGYGHMIKKETTGERFTVNLLLTRSEVAYTFFLNPRWYVKVFVEAQALPEYELLGPNRAEFDVITSTGFRVGYFVPRFLDLF